MTTLYTKQGRRYVVWGDTEHWDVNHDNMRVGTFRLTHCSSPGAYRYRHDVTPDTAAFLAACEVAAAAMEREIATAAAARPFTNSAYTPEQQAIIERFRSEMAATCVVPPVWWRSSSAREIAEAGIDAVRRIHEAPATHETLPDGSILVTVGEASGIVSSMHLVPTKERQLREREARRTTSHPTP